MMKTMKFSYVRSARPKLSGRDLCILLTPHPRRIRRRNRRRRAAGEEGVQCRQPSAPSVALHRRAPMADARGGSGGMIARSHSSGTVTQPYCRYRFSFRLSFLVSLQDSEVVISAPHLARALMNCGGRRPGLFIPWTTTTTMRWMGGWSFIFGDSIHWQTPAGACGDASFRFFWGVLADDMQSWVPDEGSTSLVNAERPGPWRTGRPRGPSVFVGRADPAGSFWAAVIFAVLNPFWYGSGGVFRSRFDDVSSLFCATTARTTESRRPARGDGCYSRRSGGCC